MSETGDKVVSEIDWNNDEVVVKAACPNLIVPRDGILLLDLMDVLAYGSWNDARSDRRVVAFEAQHRPASRPQNADLPPDRCGGDGTYPSVPLAVEPDPKDVTIELLRRRIHLIERHNQYFERCESPHCNPNGTMSFVSEGYLAELVAKNQELRAALSTAEESGFRKAFVAVMDERLEQHAEMLSGKAVHGEAYDKAYSHGIYDAERAISALLPSAESVSEEPK